MQVTKIAKTTIDKPRVIAYGRVSTNKLEQEYSLENQTKYWNRRFTNNDSVVYVGLFTDRGISGKKMTRKGLNEVLDRARSGEVDEIHTKSITRFARNYTELIAVIRELRDMGIPVIFDKEGMNTLDPKCNLLLNVMSSIAEEEIKSMSKNVKWAARKRFADGIVELTRIYGYDYTHGCLTINEKEAECVRLIFKLYLEGKGSMAIVRILNESEYKPIYAKKWGRATINKMLRNEKYMGDALLQKNLNDLGVRVKNTGQEPQYYIEDSHQAIISKEDFQRVQELLVENAERYHKADTCKRYLLSSKIKCGMCGASYKRKTYAKGQTYESIKWTCMVKDQYGKGRCGNHEIKDEIIIPLVISAYNECVENKYKYSSVNSEENTLNELLATEQELGSLRVKGYITEASFKEQKARLLEKIRIQEQIVKAVKYKNFDVGKLKKSEVLTQEMVDFMVSATVSEDWTVEFEFANGYKTKRTYTNGRSGNVNGKLCKLKA